MSRPAHARPLASATGSRAWIAAVARDLQAGQRALLVWGGDELRVLDGLDELAALRGVPLRTFSAIAGVDGRGAPAAFDAFVRERLRDPDAAALWAVLDPLDAGPRAAVRRGLRELALRRAGAPVIAVSPTLDELAGIPEVPLHPLPLPDHAELYARLAELVAALDDGAAAPDLSPWLRRVGPGLARAAAGLERFEFDAAVTRGWATLADVTAADEPSATVSPEQAIRAAIHGCKRALAARDGLLEAIAATPLRAVGGLPRLKAWLQRRATTLDPRAAAVGLAPPRGLLLVGVQGCGKSLAARACASALGLELVRLDLGRLFGGTVGESERNLRRALQAAERMAPVVVWVDEIDKGLAGADGGRSDGGAGARVLGGLLTWLQERSAPVVVVATANRVDRLPPELLRRGRFDELFFVDLPDADERAAITEVHLHAAHAAAGAPLLAPNRASQPEGHEAAGEGPAAHPSSLAPRADAAMEPAAAASGTPGSPPSLPWTEWLALARAAEGFSGAELEAALVEARVQAFAGGRPTLPDDFAAALASTVPLSRTRAEEVAALREWARTRARPA